VFFDWLPVVQEVPQTTQYQLHGRSDSVHTVTPSTAGSAGYRRHGSGRGEMIHATYNPVNPHPTSHYETLDPCQFLLVVTYGQI
jgi:hypothetical protein